MSDKRFAIFRFRFRVTTPLFLGGADPDVRAELRPPAIKGMLRDWYRILVGTKAAVEAEARYFGGTGAGAGQSPFLLAIDRRLTGEEPWRPPRVRRGDISGLGYLGYSLNLGKSERDGRKAIPPEVPFELEAVFPRGADQEQRRVLLSSVWLLAHLGGLGTRSRRGFGSLSLEGWEETGHGDIGSLPLLSEVGDAASVVRSLRDGLHELTKLSGIAEASPRESRTLGFRLAGARFFLVRGPKRDGAWSNPLDALDHVGAAMQRFRREPGLDGFSTAQMLARGERLAKAPARTAFGLPLSYRTSRGTHNFEAYLPGPRGRGTKGEPYKRFPSPLLLHVQRFRGGFVPIVTLLGGAKPGRDVPVHVHGHSCPEDPKNRVLEAFLDRLEAEGAEEVRP